jgi:predicted O-methyltransferase YrrM
MIKKPDLIFRRTLRKTARALCSATNSMVARKYLKRARVSHAEKLFSYTSRPELEALLNLALLCPDGANALEIGSHLGKSACYLASGLAARSAHLYCVDTWQNETMPEGESDTFYEFQQNTKAINGTVTKLKKPSQEVCVTDIKIPLHLVFIDGDHNYDAVKADFDKITPWLADDGVIAFHDYLYFQGVSRVIGEALSTGKWMMLGQVENLMWMGRANFTR